MSVLKSQRKESSIKFLDTAYDLELHTLKCCMKLPKRYTFFIGTELSRLASEVHNHCKMVNTPIEDIDQAALHLPDRISIHQRDGPTLEYHGYTSAVSIQKNPSNQQTMLVLREG